VVGIDVFFEGEILKVSHGCYSLPFMFVAIGIVGDYSSDFEMGGEIVYISQP
jgi:hypothetical protein